MWTISYDKILHIELAGSRRRHRCIELFDRFWLMEMKWLIRHESTTAPKWNVIRFVASPSSSAPIKLSSARHLLLYDHCGEDNVWTRWKMIFSRNLLWRGIGCYCRFNYYAAPRSVFHAAGRDEEETNRKWCHRFYSFLCAKWERKVSFFVHYDDGIMSNVLRRQSLQQLFPDEDDRQLLPTFAMKCMSIDCSGIDWQIRAVCNVSAPVWHDRCEWRWWISSHAGRLTLHTHTNWLLSFSIHCLFPSWCRFILGMLSLPLRPSSPPTARTYTAHQSQ